jgi:hypothetical protein
MFITRQTNCPKASLPKNTLKLVILVDISEYSLSDRFVMRNFELLVAFVIKTGKRVFLLSSSYALHLFLNSLSSYAIFT